MTKPSLVKPGRCDFFVGIGSEAEWLGSGDGIWFEKEPGGYFSGGGFQSVNDWLELLRKVVTDRAFYREATYRADVEGWLVDRHNLAVTSASAKAGDPWPWDAPIDVEVRYDHRNSGLAFAYVPFDPAPWYVAKDVALEIRYADLTEGNVGRDRRVRQMVEIFAAHGVMYEPELVEPNGLFWHFVENRITTPPPGRVLISRAGHEWHSIWFESTKAYKLAQDSLDAETNLQAAHYGLRRLRDDEVVDMSSRRKAPAP